MRVRIFFELSIILIFMTACSALSRAAPAPLTVNVATVTASPVPFAPPKISSMADSESALKAGDDFLEDLAREKPDPAMFAQPGIVAYSVSMPLNQSVIWAYAWCASDQQILTANFENIKLSFELEGKQAPIDSFAVLETNNNGKFCRLVYALLSQWTLGVHHLVTTATFTSHINDGLADYEAGDYVIRYTVYVNP